MSEDAFRPQRRQITEEEVAQDEVETQGANEQLAEMAAMRQRAAQEVGDDFAAPEGDFGGRVKGNVPEAFKRAAGMKGTPPAQRGQDMRVTGSGRLEELIAGIGTRGNMIYERVELPPTGRTARPTA